MGDKRVDERARPVARRRVHHETGGLVDDDEMLVLVNNIERNLFPLRNRRFRRRYGQLIRIAGFDPQIRLNYRSPGLRRVTLLDQGLHARTAQVRYVRGNEPVQPLAIVGLGSLDGEALGRIAGIDCAHSSERPQMAEPETSTQTVPGTVFSPRQVRMLKWAVIIMGVMLVGGFALVMGAIVYQASNLGESASAPVATSSSEVVRALNVPPGMSVTQLALGDNRLAVYLSGPGGSEIRIIDLGTGAVMNRLPVVSE